MERPDGSLAPVTYLFSGREAESAGRPRARAGSPERSSPAGPAWAVPGADSTDAGGIEVAGTEVAGTEGAGTEVTDTEPVGADAATASSSRQRAHGVGLNALARRGMSTAEMRMLLERRELDGETVEAELGRLRSSGLLDDAELAHTLVRTLHERKRLGRAAILAELRRRRLDSETIEQAVAVLDGEDELAVATALARKRAAQLPSCDRETAARRLSGFLQRRGYNGSVVAAATRTALSEHGAWEPGRQGPRFE